jgi:hypothetical protein
MGDRLLLRTMAAGWAGRLRAVLAVGIVGTLLSGCGGGSMFGSSPDSPSLSDRFGQLFGSKSQAVGEKPPPPAEQSELTCPSVSIRAGASTYAVGLPGKPATGSDLRYQATITRTARDCTVNSGQITARIGIQGRVIAGPAWTPGPVQIPVRVAAVQGGIHEKTIATKAYQTTVEMSESSSVPFSLVIEDLVYPAPPGAEGDSYIFYIGFDPQALKPEPGPAKRKKK